MRLQRFLALAGVASRRRSEELITQGHVSVNDRVVTELGVKIDPARDIVKVDGKKVESEKKVYVVLNKPAGFVTSVTDTHGRRTVTDLVKDLPARLYPVGRLDMDTEGVLLMTNDGTLCHHLTHPRFGVEKTYRAEVEGKPTRKSLRALARGLDIGEVVTAPAKARLVRSNPRSSVLEITLYEGRKRQIKRMCERVGHPVVKLRRVKFAGIGLKGVTTGSYRLLSDAEVRELKRRAFVNETKSENNKG